MRAIVWWWWWQVVEVNNSIVLKQNAYMLFFQRVYTPEQMARQEQQLLQLPQQLSAPQEPPQQSKSQRRRNKKKNSNNANDQQQQSSPQASAAPEVAEAKPAKVEDKVEAKVEEAKVEPPVVAWKLPKYRVFYTEEESGDESWIRDLLLVADVPSEVPHVSSIRGSLDATTAERCACVLPHARTDKGRATMAAVGGTQRSPHPPRRHCSLPLGDIPFRSSPLCVVPCRASIVTCLARDGTRP
jgi:hypothetical protein